MNEKLRFDGGTLGAPRAQTCARGVTPLDPRLAKILTWVDPAIFASCWEIRKIGSFWPKKAGKIP
jgi:hypothetical protein